MDLMLNDKVAIVTGATGICKAAALALAGEGMDIAVTYLTETDERTAQDTVKKVKAMGRKCIMLPLNLLKLSGICKMVDSVIKEYGRIDHIDQYAEKHACRPNGDGGRPLARTAVQHGIPDRGLAVYKGKRRSHGTDP